MAQLTVRGTLVLSAIPDRRLYRMILRTLADNLANNLGGNVGSC
jgi:hypothetical protein